MRIQQIILRIAGGLGKQVACDKIIQKSRIF